MGPSYEEQETRYRVQQSCQLFCRRQKEPSWEEHRKLHSHEDKVTGFCCLPADQIHPKDKREMMGARIVYVTRTTNLQSTILLLVSIFGLGQELRGPATEVLRYGEIAKCKKPKWDRENKQPEGNWGFWYGSMEKQKESHWQEEVRFVSTEILKPTEGLKPTKVPKPTNRVKPTEVLKTAKLTKVLKLGYQSWPSNKTWCIASAEDRKGNKVMKLLGWWINQPRYQH